MSHWLDNLARRAAGGETITRRRLIGTTAGAAAAATVAPVAMPQARAQGFCDADEFFCSDGLSGICCHNTEAPVCCTEGEPGGRGPSIGCCRAGQSCTTWPDDGSGACAGCPNGFTECERFPGSDISTVCCEDATEFCADPGNGVCCPNEMHACGSPGNVECCDPADECLNGECVEACPAGEVRCGFDCCGEGFECQNEECVKVCPPDELTCGNDCCPPGWICETEDGFSFCTDPCPSGEAACGPGVCCPPGEICKDGECTPCLFGEKECSSKCCPEDWECCIDDAGKAACCPPSGFCCDPATELCCKDGETCCFDAAGKRTCCPAGVECAKMILPGNAGITPDSPTVCCPPERLNTAVPAGVCCPPGSVKNPAGLSTRGGLCCTEANLCGQDCCDSTPLLPLECCGDKCCGPTDIFTCADGKCVRREDARPSPARTVTVNQRGEALIPVSCGAGGACSGSVTIQTAGGSRGSTWAEPVIGARRLVFGTRRFKVPAGRSTKVKVKLSRSGLKSLRKRKKARVIAVVRTVDDRRVAVVNRSRPFTLKAPASKKRG